MLSFFTRLLGRNKSVRRSASTARERLQFVLVTDRSQLSPEQIRQMQAEILEVIRKYCRINEAEVEMKLELRERVNYLVADIPLAHKDGSDEEPGRIGFSLQTVSDPSDSGDS
ncbi:MAG: cell division topological specificity factor MinE [Chloroflexi bacterium]|jgi:cell division topological specificity factor|nr:cell division topological specificity factor MinE [Chloroflexota bacterium]